MTDAGNPALGAEAGGRPVSTVGPHNGVHHAHDKVETTMSGNGLQRDAPLTKHSETEVYPDHRAFHISANAIAVAAESLPRLPRPTQSQQLHAHVRLHFADFARQLRLRRQHAYRQYQLARRKTQLAKVINLSERLNRVGSWTYDGLVEVVGHTDAASFAHVHQHVQDLSDTCFSQWTQETYLISSNLDVSDDDTVSHESVSFLSKLSASAKSDLLELLTTLRSKPRFLTERLKALSRTQIQTLSRGPKYEDVSDTVIASLSRSRGRMSQKKRLQAYSKGLEDYASSFERSNPLFFLMHNIYAASSLKSSNEQQLRYHTWSSICADLLQEAEPHYNVLLNQVLATFAGMSCWRVKERFELFLMDVLQRGAFLLDDDIGDTPSSSVTASSSEYLMTDQARVFFDDAVRDLFKLLSDSSGAFPTDAEQLARQIITKLPTIEYQSRFRGDFFHWFLQEYLRIAITYPENEKLLLRFHVSKRARDKVLFQLWHQSQARASDIFRESPSREVDPVVRFYVENIVGLLGPVDSFGDPYTSSIGSPSSVVATEGAALTAVIAVCSADVVHVLEALSPQTIRTSGPWDPFVGASMSAFQDQYSSTNNKFDRLRREILLYTEPGFSSKNVHPSQEQWVLLQIDRHGKLATMQKPVYSPVSEERLISEIEAIDEVQKAVIRLASTTTGAESMAALSAAQDHVPSTIPSLLDLFEDQVQAARDNADGVSTLFWTCAIARLRKDYPISILTKNDTEVLQSLLKMTVESTMVLAKACGRLDNEVCDLEQVFESVRGKIQLLSEGLDGLRIKLWYQSDVVSSDIYENARGVASALLNMALPEGVPNETARTSENRSSRPTSSASSASMFDRQHTDAMTILKAPVEHGGPRKLSDSQVDLTKKWLQRNSVDNFCRSEERIHRFCMEVKTTTKKLIADSLAESPVLWSSELFAKERYFYEGGQITLSQGYPSTRPPSMMSETMLPSVHQLRSIIRSNDSGSRTGVLDGPPTPARKASFHSLGSSKINKDLLGSDLASSFGSRSRAVSSRTVSATTAESLTSIFSPLPSNSRSITSMSSYSRPASILSDVIINRPLDVQKEKAVFLEGLQHGLVCLLLSDLGCPVWSLGSETDAWLDRFGKEPAIAKQLEHRLTTEGLLSVVSAKSRTAAYHLSKTPMMKRSASAGNSESLPQIPLTSYTNLLGSPSSLHTGSSMTEHFPWPDVLQDALAKVGQFTDPLLKLQAIQDFRSLAVAHLSERAKQVMDIAQGTKHFPVDPAGRRRSLNPWMGGTQGKGGREDDGGEGQGQYGPSNHKSQPTPTESEIVRHLKVLFYEMKPKALFRDLQYIAAFVPSDTLNKTESGRAFFQVGLAALAYKEEVCRSMVDVADRLAARDLIKRKTDSTEQKDQLLSKAAEYWIHAAREGNAIAQRELASLYLTHPRMVPIVSLSLSMASETFKTEMMWEKSSRARENWQALCLALHWMQQAAWNGDRVAQEKLQEREDSLR